MDLHTQAQRDHQCSLFTRPQPADTCACCFYRGDPRCADTGEPSDQKAEAPVRVSRARTPTSQRPGSPTAQPQKGAQQCHAARRLLRPAGWEGGPGEAPIPTGRGPSCRLNPALRLGRPAQAALRAGRARVRAEGGRPEPESPLPSPHLSFPRRSTTSTKWQSAAPRAGRDAPRPAGRARRPPHDARSGGGRALGGSSGTAAALPRPHPPGNRAAAGAGPEPARACALRPPSR